MKKFTVTLLSIIFVALIACSIQSISADHLEPGQGIFKDKTETYIAETKDSKYQVYLQTILRNGDGELINVTESTATAAYIPHKLTDDIFDQLMGEKKIFTIGNIKYEKVQYTYTPSLEHRFINFYPIYSEIELNFDVTEESTAKMYEKNKDYAHWKIHFCATFNEEHGYQCIAVFQVLVPTMTLEPNDVVTQQWTILREMN